VSRKSFFYQQLCIIGLCALIFSSSLVSVCKNCFDILTQRFVQFTLCVPKMLLDDLHFVGKPKRWESGWNQVNDKL
jgi:hypothetical protein